MNRKSAIILFSLLLTGITISAVSSVQADIYNVYRDVGIPADSKVWTWDQSQWGGPAASYNGDYADSTAPEGSKSFRVDNPGTYAGWGVFLIYPNDNDHTVNLSNYDSLKFWLKTSTTRTNLIKIEIQETNRSGKKSNAIYFSGSKSWQEITIPKSSFSGVNFNQIFSPFMVTMNSSGTFYIDNVRWTSPNSSPNPPSGLGPTEYVNGSWGYENEAIILEFTQSDPDTEDTLKYTILVDNNSDFSSPEVVYTSGLLPQGLTSYALPALADGGYYWAVQSVDNHGAESSWAVANGGNVAFGIDKSVPSTPVVTDDGDYTSSMSQLHATWSSSDDQSGIAEYQYAIGTTEGGTDVVGWTSAGTATSVTKTGLSLVNGEKYYFAVRAKNWAELWSSVGNSNGITVNINVPASPQLVSPQDGSATNDTTPTFDWSDVTDPSGITYQIQVDNSGDSFPSPEINVSGLTSSTYTPTTALPVGTYWWRVNARSGVGTTGGWSATRTLVIDTTAPEAPTLISPIDNDVTNDTTPSFDWSDVSDPSGVTYEIQVGVISRSGITSSGYTLDTALDYGTYIWKVRAKDGAGNLGNWSPSRTLTIANLLSYNIYTDYGLPYLPSPYRSDIYKWSAQGPDGFTLTEVEVTSEAPEGTKFLEATVPAGNSWAGWGVFFFNRDNPNDRYGENLSDYANGYLKFWVRTTVNLKVEIQNTAGTTKTKYIGDYGWNQNFVWQEISIPIRDLTTDTSFLSNIYSPFSITAETDGVVFKVDNVRWVKVVEMPGASKVTVVGRQLFVNDNLFTVKGVCYSPTPVGESSGYDWSSSPANYSKDFALLKAMGCNSIRVYKPPTQKAAMDALYLNGIYVIMDYPISWSTNVSDPATRQSIKNGFLDMVNTWKNHPAVLMWNLGNEMNGHVSSLSDWYSLVNECAQAAHSVDPNHPVTASCQDVGGGIETQIGSYNSLVPYMDIWSVQLYRGVSFGNLFTSFATKSSKPLLLTEFGCDGYNGSIGSEDQNTQSTYLDSQWTEIKNNLSSTSSSKGCIGGCVFEWSDEWWKHSGGSNSFHDIATDWTNSNYSDPNMNEEWWGIVSIAPATYHKTQRRAWYTLQGWWRTTPLMTVTLKKISDNTVPQQQLLTWTNVNPGRDVWKVADQYLQLDADTSFPEWGIQIYTDNCAADANPQFYIVNPSSVNPAGLVATDNRKSTLPLCWKITDEVWTASSPPPEQGGPGPGPQDPVEVPDPLIPNAYYFSNNYLWVKDRKTPDDPMTPKNLLDETFVDGEYYVTVWDQNGIQWGGDPSEHGGGLSSPNYIYFGGKFINATTPRTYRTDKITLEMYFP
jgi:hypothetical protein